MTKDIKGHDKLEYSKELSLGWGSCDLVIYKYKPKLHTEFIKDYPDFEKMKGELSEYMDAIFIEEYYSKNSEHSYSTVMFIKPEQFYIDKGYNSKCNRELN